VAINVFISYAHEDIAYKEALLKRLKPLSRSGVLEVWHDGEIKTGEKWDDSIKAHLQQADIVILLISVDFIASDYIFEEELPTIITKKIANQLELVPIIVRDVNLADSSMSDFQCLPQDAEKRLKPIVRWENEGAENEVWVQIDEKIRAIIKEVQTKKAQSSIPTDINLKFKLGRHHLVTCDRVDQFDEFMLQSKGPQKINYFYLFGQEYQSINGFFERIQNEKLGNLLDYLNPDHKSSRRVKAFEMTFELSKNREIYLENIYKSLMTSFYDSIDAYAPILEHTILDLLANSPKIAQLTGKDYLCILLTMSQEDWYKDITPDVVREVIQKFFNHPIPEDKPSILLFFGTTYEENDGEVEQEIRAAIQDGEYLKILPELEEVGNSFIVKWFKKYNAFFKLKPKQLDALRKKYFQDDIYDMDDIETSLATS